MTDMSKDLLLLLAQVLFWGGVIGLALYTSRRMK